MELITGSARRLGIVMLAAVVVLIPSMRQPVAEEAATSKTFSQQELDEVLAPIALYPDALLAQVLMASTYPMEVVEAARWAKANPDLKDKALEDALQEQSWDPAVKAIVAVPQVLTMMDEKLDWTQKLGDAFLVQQEEVMRTVQNLRGKAKDAGNLETTSQQVVKTEEQGGQTVVIIESAEPEKVYVPVYNPTVIYGSWWYPAPPPYYYYPPGYVAGPGLWFTAGVIVGGAIWGGCNWGRNEININVNKYNSFNRTNIKTGDWNHNPSHRKGVSYRDQATAQKYGRGSDRAAAQSREQFRGRAEQGRAELGSMDRGQLDKKVQAADRAGHDLGAKSGKVSSPGSRDLGAANRDLGAGNRDLGRGSRDLSAGSATRDLTSRPSGSASNRAGSSSGSRGGGFSGVGSGSSTRAASARGSASFGGAGRGGGMRSGGRGR
ncbi:MAG: DUF3300 domain-containing protein [Sedimenticolaceae bacterium]